jgi:hypothetical protein
MYWVGFEATVPASARAKTVHRSATVTGAEPLVVVVYFSFIMIYLGMTITNQNLIQEEIKSRLNSGNACYHSAKNSLFSSAI